MVVDGEIEGGILGDGVATGAFAGGEAVGTFGFAVAGVVTGAGAAFGDSACKAAACTSLKEIVQKSRNKAILTPTCNFGWCPSRAQDFAAMVDELQALRFRTSGIDRND